MTMDHNNRPTAALDPYLSKESLSVLATMGFGKKEPWHGPHKHHGIAARTRLSIAGNSTMKSVAQHRHQHHKERVTIQQVNELSKIARDIEKHTKDGRRVPAAVWEQYDRVNKRHKRHEEMVALAVKMRKAGRQRVQIGVSNKVDKMDEERKNVDQNRANRWSKSTTIGCTFGSGRDDNSLQKNIDEGCRGPSSDSTKFTSPSTSQAAWGWYEREKLNELYWDMGRPPRRSAAAAREHFHRYTQRHCMVFPHRSPAAVVKKLKLMFRYNAMKEPNEKEHWLKLGASKGFVPVIISTPKEKRAIRPKLVPNRPSVDAVRAMGDALHDESELQQRVETGSIEGSSRAFPPAPPEAVTRQVKEPLFRRSGGGMSSTFRGGGGGVERGGGGLLSAAAAAYAADAIAISSCRRKEKPTMVANNWGSADTSSPFHDPIRPKSPAWAFGEAPGCSRPRSRVDSRRWIDSRGGSPGGSPGDFRERDCTDRSLGNGIEHFSNPDEEKKRVEETELLDYTSLGRQTVSHRVTSPAHVFSREGLGSESLSMFQADKRPEPGPGSFKPDLTATSTHPGPRCGVVMRQAGSKLEIDSRGAGVTGDIGGCQDIRPGPGHYNLWDAIGRQVLSTRPSSPTVVFATGDWELR